jgi:hypothetical protein
LNRASIPILLLAALTGLAMLTCDVLQTADVTLEISGSPLAAFTGYYETTSNGQTQVSGSPPKSFTFQARKQYDIVAAQLIYAGVGEMTAKLVSGGVTRDSEAISNVGVISLLWVAK